MKKYTFLNIAFIFILFCSVLSCNSKKEYENIETFSIHSFKQTNSLKGTAIPLDEPVMRPVKVYVVDSFLILINAHTETFIDRYNLNTLKKTGEYISFGSGPEEMIAPIGIITKDTFIGILDGGKQNFVLFDKKEFCHAPFPNSCKTLSFDDLVDNIEMLKNENIVTTIRSYNHQRLSFFNKNGGFLETKGEYPIIKNQHINITEKLAGYVCSIVSNEAKDKIFIAYKQTDLIEIYDMNGNLMVRKQGPDFFYPSVIVQKSGDEETIRYTKGETRDAYFCPTIYKDEIYVLYSGEIYDPTNYKFNKNKIFVFDWKGNPIRIHNLETPVFSFTIDQQTGILYGLSDDPEFHVVKMQL